ncbi:MAG: nucleotidyltransferase domain-containing protein [Proteobacteria bacterium]|nr:nucleotidyltransferase domain-containing protein [Pseudomonadota bacterium]
MSGIQKNVGDFQFFQELIALPFVEQVFLYGSRARGSARERSDIDLAVKCPGASEQDWIKVLDIIEDADTLLKIDCIRFDELSDNNPLKKSILRDGVTLFVRSKNVSRNQRSF